MTSSPVVEFRAAGSPNGVISNVAFTGTGFGGAIPIGTTSTVQTIRLYNNFANAAGVADATSCVLAVYDDPIHQSLAISTPTTKAYVQVQVADYNGDSTSGDSQFYPIGGQSKHALPTNGGTLSGTGTNYVTINIQVAVLPGATAGAVSQGLWVEYTSTS